MKRKFAVALTTALILTNITACNHTQTQPENQVSVSDSISPAQKLQTQKVITLRQPLPKVAQTSLPKLSLPKR